MAHSAERPTLDFGSGHDLMVREFEHRVGRCDDRADPASDSLSPSLSVPPQLAHSLSLSQINKLKKKKDQVYPRNTIDAVTFM